MFAGRKRKKREFRTLWQIKISAAARENGTSYSKLINALKKKHIELDRKILAELAEFHPDTFKKVLEATQ